MGIAVVRTHLATYNSTGFFSSGKKIIPNLICNAFFYFMKFPMYPNLIKETNILSPKECIPSQKAKTTATAVYNPAFFSVAIKSFHAWYVFLCESPSHRKSERQRRATRIGSR